LTHADCYFVLSADDEILYVSEPLHRWMGRFVGHSLWVKLPRAELIFRPHFQEARRTGRELEFVAFYAGGTIEMRIVPSGELLTVYPNRLSELNVRTLATLTASLETIASELAAPAPARRGRPVPVSLQALP